MIPTQEAIIHLLEEHTQKKRFEAKFNKYSQRLLTNVFETTVKGMINVGITKEGNLKLNLLKTLQMILIVLKKELVK